MSSRRGPKIIADTPLARLRAVADLTQAEALEEAKPFLVSCSLRTWRSMEGDPARVPPALLDRFRQLVRRKRNREVCAADLGISAEQLEKDLAGVNAK